MKTVVLAGTALLTLALVSARWDASEPTQSRSGATVGGPTVLPPSVQSSFHASIKKPLFEPAPPAVGSASAALQNGKRMDKTLITGASEAMRQARQKVEDLRLSTGDGLRELWQLARKGDASAAVAFYLASSHSTVQVDDLASELRMTQAELKRKALELLQSAASTDPYAGLLFAYQAGWMVPRSGMNDVQQMASLSAARATLLSLVERGYQEAYPVLVSTLISGELGHRDISLAKFLLDYSGGTWEDDRRAALAKVVESGLKEHERNNAAELLARTDRGESLRSVIGSRL